MFILINSLIAVLILAGALFANQIRARRQIKFDLRPNCLLTRFPILFVTGPRSLFYFLKYWNQYPEVLAEHGYEVFTLHLPWSQPHLRLQKLKDFLKTQSELGLKFHLFTDSPTFNEISQWLDSNTLPSALLSLTTIKASSTLPPLSSDPISRVLPYQTIELPVGTSNCGLRLMGRAHQLLCRKYTTPPLEVLGAAASTGVENAWHLLERAQELAEADFTQG